MAKKTIQLLASDLDGTLFYDGKQSNSGVVCQENVEAIRRWLALGNHFIIASGRPSRYLKFFQQDYQLKADMIACNGAKVVFNQQVLWSKEVQPQEISDLIQVLQPFENELDLCFDMDTEYRVGYKENGVARQKFCHGTDYFTIEEYMKRLKPVLPNKIFIILDQPERMNYFIQLLETQFHHRLYVTSSGKGFMELGPYGVSKGTALAYLAEQMGYSMEQTAAIGDELNDLDMLLQSGHGYVMSHARDEMKQGVGQTMNSVAQLIDWCISYNEDCD